LKAPAGRVHPPAGRDRAEGEEMTGDDDPEAKRNRAANAARLAAEALPPEIEPITSSKAGGLIGNRQRRF